MTCHQRANSFAVPPLFAACAASPGLKPTRITDGEPSSPTHRKWLQRAASGVNFTSSRDPLPIAGDSLCTGWARLLFPGQRVCFSIFIIAFFNCLSRKRGAGASGKTICIQGPPKRRDPLPAFLPRPEQIGQSVEQIAENRPVVVHAALEHFVCKAPAEDLGKAFHGPDLRVEVRERDIL